MPARPKAPLAVPPRGCAGFARAPVCGRRWLSTDSQTHQDRSSVARRRLRTRTNAAAHTRRSRRPRRRAARRRAGPRDAAERARRPPARGPPRCRGSAASPAPEHAIQPGRSSSGTLTPQKMSSMPKMMLDSTAVSRTRRPAPAPTSPSPVQEKAQTAIDERRSAAQPSRRDVDAEDQRRRRPARTTATTKPLTMTGSARPRNSGTPRRRRRRG